MARTGIDLSQYRSLIGLWTAMAGGGRQRSKCRIAPLSSWNRQFFRAAVLLFLLLRAEALPSAGDVERNPGPPFSVTDSNSNFNSHIQRSRGAARAGLTVLQNRRRRVDALAALASLGQLEA